MRRLTYKSAGVDISEANEFLACARRYIESTRRKGAISQIGGFGGLFSLDMKRYKEPVLASSTDGVGTKLVIASLLGKHDTVGIDLVAMNANDVLCTGAEPLFFLDYIACGKLNKEILTAVIKGITKGCREAGCALIGGETAEMPGMYGPDEYDLAGFCVGVVERRKIIDGRFIKSGDRLVGLASSGLHSNGYSLVRKIFSEAQIRKSPREFLKPTRIYARQVLALLRSGIKIKGIAHITGGAFQEKLLRIIPDGLGAQLHIGSWPVPRIFKIIQREGDIDEREMYRTFNMGVGMMLVVEDKYVEEVLRALARLGQRAHHIGAVIEVDSERRRLVFKKV